MNNGRSKFGTKKRIYAVAVMSIAALVFLTVLFVNVLNQQRALLHDIEARHFDKIADLTAQFSELSANHVRLVDLLTSTDGPPTERSVRRVGTRFTRNLERLAGDLDRTQPRFVGPAKDVKAFGRLVNNMRAYRLTTAAAIKVASSDRGAALKRLSAANRNYRRISQEFETLIRNSRDHAETSIAASIKGFDVRTYQFVAGVVVIIALLALLAMVMLRTVLKDISGITGAMSELTTGRTDVHIPGLERRDEIGEMARATAVFRSNLEQLEALADMEDKAQHLQREVARLAESKDDYERKVEELNADAERLAEARDAAEAASRAKSELLAGISYDIRTPMNGLMGMAGLMGDTELSKEQRDFVDGIRQSGTSLLGVINNLLDYTKLEAGQIELEISDFDLVETIESAPRLIPKEFSEKSARLLCCIGQDVPQFVEGDPGRLGQALVSLLYAASKASDAGDLSMDVSVDSREAADAMVRFEVSDHSDAAAASDDEPQEPRDGGRADDEANSLAAAISAHIAALMGGEAGYTRDEDGTRRYWMTVRIGVAENPAEDWRARTPKLFNRRALVVDGSAGARNTLVRQLEAWGLSVDHANDGRSALSRMARADSDQAQYDMVLTNLSLPDMTGVALVRAMRSSEGSADVPAILNFAGDEQPDNDQLTDLNVTACVQRPMAPTRLLGSLLAASGAIAVKEVEKPVAEPVEAETHDGDEETAGRQLRILLADDNQMNQKVVTAMLATTEHSVDVVGNGVEALEAAKGGAYDIILMDIQMPDMDGVEATREIRCLSGEAANVPIIALTANAMEGDRDKYLAAGMDDYVAKPIDRGDLMAAIERQSRTLTADDAGGLDRPEQADADAEAEAEGPSAGA